MKNTNAPQEAKYFKYKFTKLMIAIAIAVLVLCAAGIAVSVYRLVTYGIKEFDDVLQSPLLILVCIFCIVLVISMLAKSQYVIDGKHLITQFGFIKSKFLIKDVTSIVYNTDEKKLTVYMGEQYMVLSMNSDWNDQFVQALREANKNIDYSFTLSDGEKKNRKKK